jgi:diaminohydroxyphosphoribosylaminopyrimidine deaminase/5-amino-6-(5-phosphoribosylamino)uracil reductase
MARALALAERGRATASPNPLVGCVIVNDGELVGEGYHEHAGGWHAEAAALVEAGPDASGAEAYVTLEPCDHTGRTPPCSQALVDAGVGRVMIALADPHTAAGGGASTLRAAGVEVTFGLGEAEARRQNEVFLHGVWTERPFVVAKSAVSLDGRVAAADGTSQWLTGEATREQAHRLRASADAVVVGSGTVLGDDPRLTCRAADYQGPQPLRVVLDTRGRTSPRARVCDEAAPTLVVVGEAADEEAATALRSSGVEVAVVAATGDRVELQAVLAELWARDLRSVLVEGGPELVAAVLREGLWDKLVLHLAPLLLGDRGVPLLAGADIPTLSRAPRMALTEVSRADEDAMLELYPAKSPFVEPAAPSPV